MNEHITSEEGPMDFAQARELIRLRHELRRLLADKRRDEARVVIDQLRTLVAASEEEAAAMAPELERWACSFAL
jgi:hypothetical protein